MPNRIALCSTGCTDLRASGDTPVLILTGPPGVGKTTTAKILGGRSGPAVHLEADLFFRFIISGYVEPWKRESQDQNALVMGIVADAATSYARAGYRTLVDGIVIPRWFLAPLRDALSGAGLQVAYAVLRAPLSVCASRIEAREGLGFSDPAAIEKIWLEFAELGEFERNVVEVDGLTPDQVADAIALRLADGDLAV